MDPRKTVRIADFERALRESRPIIIARPVIAVGQPERVASLTQTLVWGSGEDSRPPNQHSPFGERTTLNDLKAASAPSLADELEARVNEVTRPRTKVELETQEVQRLAAEVWASQASAGLQTMATTWRDQPLERSSQPGDRPTVPRAAPVAAPAAASETEPATVLETDLPAPDRISTDALSPVGRIMRRLQLPARRSSSTSAVHLRRLQLPSLRGTRGLRIACGALCALCAAITWMSIAGVLDARTADAPAATPALARPPQAASAPPAAPSGQGRAPAAAETNRKSAPVANVASATPAPPSAAPVVPSSVTPRSAVDALMAGKHDLALKRYRALAQSFPSHPAYAAAARILAESEQTDPEDL